MLTPVRANRSAGLMVLGDGTPESAPTLLAAFRQASLRHLPLTVVHCLPDPDSGSWAQDLHLMDETARLEAEFGCSQLGFQRRLLQDQVRRMEHQFPTVSAHVVLDDAIIDGVLEALPQVADLLVVDRAYGRRVHDLMREITSKDLACIVSLLPAVQRNRVSPEVEAALLTELERAEDVVARTPADGRLGLPGPELAPVRIRAVLAEQRGPWHHLRWLAGRPDVA